MKKIFTFLLTILCCASVNASNKNSVSFQEESVEKQKYKFVINKKSNQYKTEEFTSINCIDNEKKDNVYFLTIKPKSLFQLVSYENLQDILSVCCAFENLKILDLKDFDFEEQYIAPINRISSLKTLKVYIPSFSLILKTLKTLYQVEDIFILAENEGDYECDVKDMPENFKKYINRLSVQINCFSDCHQALVNAGLPELGKTSEFSFQNWMRPINSNLDVEKGSFSKKGFISEVCPFTRSLYIGCGENEMEIFASYFPKEEIDLFTIFFNQNKDIPFQYNNTEGQFRVFTRKNEDIK